LPHDTDPTTIDWAEPVLLDAWNAIQHVMGRLTECFVAPAGVPLDPNATWDLLELLESTAYAVVHVTVRQWFREDPDLLVRTCREMQREGLL